MAGELIKIAAARQLREAPRLTVAHGMYEEFCAGFPYDETEDQETVINAVLDDLGSGKPMDRLVCGDVGFGKTEVALRAAFIAAMNGKQVAVVVPTTLLARQHYKTFSERFRAFPVSGREARRARAGCWDTSGARATEPHLRKRRRAGDCWPGAFHFWRDNR